jgi:hypothetical protein
MTIQYPYIARKRTTRQQPPAPGCELATSPGPGSTTQASGTWEEALAAVDPTDPVSDEEAAAWRESARRGC